MSGNNWQYEPPPRDNALDLVRSDFWPNFWRPFFHIIVRAGLVVLFRFRVRGRKNIPRRGPFILIANHAGHPDAVALMSAIPWTRINTTHSLGAKDYFWKKKWIGALVHTTLNVVPLDREGGMQSLDDAKQILHLGHGIIMFPEGTRSKTGELGQFKRGIGALVAGTNIPVVPAAIFGSRDVLPKGSSRIHFAKMAVNIGAPRSYDDAQNNLETATRIANQLQGDVAKLMELP